MCSADTIVARYEGYEIDLLSNAPLVGSLELAGQDDEVINLKLGKDDAKRLIKELTRFIATEEVAAA